MAPIATIATSASGTAQRAAFGLAEASAGSSPITRVVGASDGCSSDGAAPPSGSMASSASASSRTRRA